MFEYIFKFSPEKVKNTYSIKDDGTRIDSLIKFLHEELGNKIVAISVRGLKSGENNFDFKQLPHSFQQSALFWKTSKKIDPSSIREYYLKLYVNYDELPFRICNMNWVSKVDTNLKSGTSEDFYYNRTKAFNLLKPLLSKHTTFFMLSVFCGQLPGSSWPARCYIKIILHLPITPLDVFFHCGITNITDFGRTYKNRLGIEFEKLVKSNPIPLSELYLNKSVREKYVREAENMLRLEYGFRNVGDSFINESLLANILKNHFPDLTRQFKAKWLGKYIIDIFIPSINVAIEYNGLQHYEPINAFGGQKKFEIQKKRDERLRLLCKQNEIELFEWHYSISVTELNVLDFLKTNHLLT